MKEIMIKLSLALDSPVQQIHMRSEQPMRTHLWEDGHNADCFKLKVELPFIGGLAFLLEERRAKS